MHAPLFAALLPSTADSCIARAVSHRHPYSPPLLWQRWWQMLSRRHISKKINYDALKTLFSDDEDDGALGCHYRVRLWGRLRLPRLTDTTLCLQRRGPWAHRGAPTSGFPQPQRVAGSFQR